MNFTDRFFHIPKKTPPSRSWWATPQTQASREVFTNIARQEHDRIVGNKTFGGRKRIIDKGYTQ